MSRGVWPPPSVCLRWQGPWALGTCLMVRRLHVGERKPRIAGHPVRGRVTQIVQRPALAQIAGDPAEQLVDRKIAELAERARQRPPQRVILPGRDQPVHLRLMQAQPTNASGDAGSCIRREPLRITVTSCWPASTSPFITPSSSAARAPVETKNAIRARSRCDRSPANSSLNFSSGMHRGERRAIFGSELCPTGPPAPRWPLTWS
jgi:hypothetical protein